MGGAAGSGGAGGGPGGVVRRGVYGEHRPQHVAEAQLRHPHLAILPAGPERRRGERTAHARSARRRTLSDGRASRWTGDPTASLPFHRSAPNAHFLLRKENAYVMPDQMLLSCLPALISSPHNNPPALVRSPHDTVPALTPFPSSSPSPVTSAPAVRHQHPPPVPPGRRVRPANRQWRRDRREGVVCGDEEQPNGHLDPALQRQGGRPAAARRRASAVL